MLYDAVIILKGGWNTRPLALICDQGVCSPNKCIQFPMKLCFTELTKESSRPAALGIHLSIFVKTFSPGSGAERVLIVLGCQHCTITTIVIVTGSQGNEHPLVREAASPFPPSSPSSTLITINYPQHLMHSLQKNIHLPTQLPTTTRHALIFLTVNHSNILTYIFICCIQRTMQWPPAPMFLVTALY